MSAQDVTTLAACSAMGALAGWTLGRLGGALVGLGIGAGYALVANRLLVRAALAVTVFAGTAVGVLLGRNIVRVLCLPGSCVGAEVTASLLLGAGALVGVGLVAALVTRSFDEYRDTIAPRPEDDPPR
jgi:hypothetical protein